MVPATARTSQLEAKGCDKPGSGDGGRDKKYWGGELIGGSMGRSEFFVMVWDAEGPVFKDVKDQARSLLLLTEQLAL